MCTSGPNQTTQNTTTAYPTNNIKMYTYIIFLYKKARWFFWSFLIKTLNLHSNKFIDINGKEWV